MKPFCVILLLLFAVGKPVYSQPAFNGKSFFLDEAPLKVILTADLKYLIKEKVKSDEQKAVFTVLMPDSTYVSEEIKVEARGVMRRKICNLPPLKLNFDNPTSPKLKSLKSLKLVNICRSGSSDEQLLLKEYLIYKMFNLLTDRSFRVRLLYITYKDSEGKIKTDSKYAFVVEDVDVMAKRNDCKEINDLKLTSESTDREQVTLVYLFQYMIGNTDWSVPNNHNIKLIMPKNKANAKPLAVPYDFDFTGLVNADYAVPNEMMDIENVTQRRYRGFPRTHSELQTVIQQFNLQKENIYALVNNCNPLNTASKKEMISYLNEFYGIIKDEKRVKFEFIDNARSQ